MKSKTFLNSLKPRAIWFPLFFLGFLQERVLAHGFAYYASTPVTPPIEFRWWWPISMLLLVIGTYIPFRMSIKWSRITSLLMAVFCVAAFAVVFFWMGRQVSLSSTGPEKIEQLRHYRDIVPAADEQRP